jgi:hypothetical protein
MHRPHLAPPAVTALCTAFAVLVAAAGPALAEDSRRLTRTVPWRGQDVVHELQLHRGVPVVGAGAVSLADGTLVASTERDALTVDVTPSISAEAALAIAQATVDHADGGSATLSVLPTGGGGRLVYRAELSSWLPVRWWMVTVDALTGDVVRVDDLVRRAEGWVYEHNPVLSELSTVELQDMHSVAGGGTMYGDHAMVCSIVFSGNDIDCVFTATSTGSGDFFHEPDDPSVDDPFVEVMVYHHLTELTHHFMDVHGHEFPDTATSYVNYRESANGTYENAGYANIDGFHLFLFGQGEVMDYGYDGDVIAHEFGHAVVHGRTDLVHGYLATYDDFGGNIAPGALDEGLADYFSCSYHDGAPMGEYISGGDAMRDLTNDHTCPADVVGESHGDGQIPGGAMWDIREQFGAGIADALAYGALGLITPSPSLREFAEAVSLTAADMVDAGELTQSDLDTIDAILTDRGLYACGRSIPLVDGVPVTLTLGHLEGYGMETLNPTTCNSFRDDGVRFDSRFQWELQLPSADDGEVESIEIELDLQRLDGQDVDSDDLQYEVYGRIDSLVTFDITDIDSPTLTIPLPIPTARSFDGHWDQNPGAIRITRSHLDGMSLAPGATLYFTAVHMNCPATALTLTPHVTVDIEYVPVDDDDEDGDGCECNGAGTNHVLPTLLLLIASLGLIRRRAG